MFASSWMPIDFSCWVKMATLVARRWLPAVVSYFSSALTPLQVQMAELFAVGLDGPPVQCAASSARAFVWLKFQMAKCGIAVGADHVLQVVQRLHGPERSGCRAP